MLPASTAWNWARVLSRCTGARHQFRSSNLPANLQKTSLDSQALAAFGATGSDHCAAAAGFHARQETVGTGALDFGRLVCAFHDKSYWPFRACYWAVSCEASFGDSNDLGGCTKPRPIWQVSTTGNTPATNQANDFARKSTSTAAQAASSRYESGKPVIITDFSLLATKPALALAQRANKEG